MQLQEFLLSSWASKGQCKTVKITNSSDNFSNLEFQIYEFFLTNTCLDFLFNWRTEKKTVFGAIRSCWFSFLTVQCQTEKDLLKKLGKQIGEIIWWIRYYKTEIKKTCQRVIRLYIALASRIKPKNATWLAMVVV